ncbi:organic cation/carnitine transporter 2-like [Liolophura sinensis]|uniref:organic cation/carnitine transporter 2-like n=1 Tax=Liolophura sinensis TaxID=3198878 RepID=UPI0031585EC1
MSVDTAYHKTCLGLVDLINGTMTETGRCDSGYEYDLHKHSTSITEWDLVCDKSYQAQLTQTVLVIVHMMAIQVMPLEVLPRSRRATIHMLGLLLWTAFLCVLVALAYGFKDYNWRYFQLTTVVATVATLIPNMLFLDESLRWLLANGRTDEARGIINKAAKMNGIHPDHVLDVTENCLAESIALHTSQNSVNQHTDKKSNLLDMFRHRKLRNTAFIMCFAWIVNAGTSFGLSLTAAKLSGDRFLNYFLILVANLPAGIISYFTMQRIGRRTTCIVSHFIAGSALLSAALINTYLGPSGWVTGLTVVGKFGISMSWGTLFQYTPELYPTNLRSVGLGIASSSSRIGGMLAPFATIVIDYYPWLPGTIYGSCCIGVGFLLLLLTETVDKELPQTIEEIKNWEKRS